MNTQEKQEKLVEYSKKKFKQYKLSGWHLYFTNHYGTLGMCYYKEKKIRMSIPWITTLNLTENKQTFLHELAHALTDKNARSHGSEWRANCKRVGCSDWNGTYYYSGEKQLPKKYKTAARQNKYYRGECPSCGRTIHRTRRTSCSCARCSGGSYNTDFKIVWTPM